MPPPLAHLKHWCRSCTAKRRRRHGLQHCSSNDTQAHTPVRRGLLGRMHAARRGGSEGRGPRERKPSHVKRGAGTSHEAVSLREPGRVRSARPHLAPTQPALAGASAACRPPRRAGRQRPARRLQSAQAGPPDPWPSLSLHPSARMRCSSTAGRPLLVPLPAAALTLHAGRQRGWLPLQSCADAAPPSWRIWVALLGDAVMLLPSDGVLCEERGGARCCTERCHRQDWRWGW